MNLTRYMSFNQRKNGSPSMQAKYTCRHCHRVFVIENRYLQHKCKQMKRLEEMQSPLGQTAWSYYQKWLRAMKRLPPLPNAFLTSKYFRTFNNFAKFAKAVDLPSVDKFVWLMVEKDYPPTIWTSDDVYTLYLEFLDHKSTPMEQLKLSIETLLTWCDKRELEISQAFEKMYPTDVIHLVRIRRLSPWLLLFCPSFKKMFRERVSPEQTIILETLIRPEFWHGKFKEHPEIVEKIKEYIKELNL